MNLTNIQPDFSNQQRLKIIDSDQKLKTQTVSFAFVTYNRCPSPNFEENPLTWALLTLANNSLKAIDEYIIVVDGSTDYTRQNIDWLSDQHKLPIRALYHQQRKGCSFRRNEAVKQVKNSHFFFGDDDCLYSYDFILGALSINNQLMYKYGPQTAVLSLPVFEMDTRFRDTESLSKIGKTDFKNTWFYHNFDCFPSEYQYYESLNDLAQPFEIDTFKGVTLNSKAAFLDAGHFLDLSVWDNDYSEHIEVSEQLQQSGYRLFHLPDRRSSALHIKFGEKRTVPQRLKTKKFAGLNLTLGEISQISNNSNTDTGCRTTEESFIFSKIGSFLSFYLKHVPQRAIDFASMEFKMLVLEPNKAYPTDKRILTMNVEQRYQLWHNAIKKSLAVTRQQTNHTYDDFYSTLMTKISLPQ